jgi:flap endonuclease-1
MGCDYTETIKGVGPVTAYNLIKEHKTIDEAIKNLTPRLKENIPADWNYAEARQLFVNPEVTSGSELDVRIYIYIKGLPLCMD